MASKYPHPIGGSEESMAPHQAHIPRFPPSIPHDDAASIYAAAAGLASLSRSNDPSIGAIMARNDESIDYLMAQREMARRITVGESLFDESLRLRQSLLANEIDRLEMLRTVVGPLSKAGLVGFPQCAVTGSGVAYDGLSRHLGRHYPTQIGVNHAQFAPSEAAALLSSNHEFASKSLKDSNSAADGSSKQSISSNVSEDSVGRNSSSPSLNVGETSRTKEKPETHHWEQRFEELKEYHRQNGHANVPKIYPENQPLSCWVHDQQTQYRRFMAKKPSDMTVEKVERLTGLGFKWGSWENWLKELLIYKKQHGNVDVPLKYKPNMALGAFVSRQRTEYRKLKQGLQSTLNEQRIQDLEAVGFNWSVRVSRTPWEERLNELKRFKEEHGHTNVPSTYPKNQPLAYWVFKQRGQYRVYMDNLNSSGKVVCHINPERIAMLDEVGFEWNPPGRIRLK